MAWIESHDDIWEHHKTIRLAALLRVDLVAAVGHLNSLWHFVLRNAWETADLTAWGDDGIEVAARWKGKRGEFVKSARDCGWLDGSIAHGWMERAGALVLDRMRKKSARSKNVRELSGESPGQSEATVPYRTVPNSTVPNPTEKNVSARRAFIPPTIPEIRDYCLEKKAGIDPEHFFNHYEANGWMRGPNKIKNWKACVNTWLRTEKNNGTSRQAVHGRVVGAAAATPSDYD